MQKSKQLFLIIILMVLAGCSKEGIQIGSENPEQEIQKCMRLSQKKAYEETVECLEIFKSRFSGSDWGESAELQIADTYFRQREFLLAAEAYQTFLKLHPVHRQADYALYRTGLSYLRNSPKAIDRDQKDLYRALEEYKQFAEHFPTSPYIKEVLADLDEVERRIADRIFYIARFYYRTKEYLSAIPRLEELVQKFPDSKLVPETLYLLTQSNLETKQLEAAREAVEKLVLKYPKYSWTKKAQDSYLKAVKG